MTDVISQSPDHEQALAAGIFHLNRCSLAPRVFHLKRHAIVQALAPRIFHPNHYSTEQVFAPRVVDLNRRDLAPRIFHLNHHTIRQALAPDSFVSGLKSGWRVLEDADFPALADQVVLLRWKQ